MPARSNPHARTAENWQPDSAQRGALLRSVYRGVLVVCSLLYYVSLPLVLALVVAVGGGLVYGMFAIGYIPIKLGLIAIVMVCATCWALVKSLFHQTTNEDPGVHIDLSAEPELRRVLDEVATTIGTRSVDKVFLAPNTNLAVFERNRGERCLVLGAGVLHGMPLTAFKAILAHEYGHFSNRDTAGGGLALRVRRTLLLFIIGLAQSGNASWWNPTWLFVTGFYKLAARLPDFFTGRTGGREDGRTGGPRGENFGFRVASQCGATAPSSCIAERPEQQKPPVLV